MKGVFFLSLVGAAIYGALLVSHDFLLSDRAKDRSFAQSLGDASERRLRLWGSDLPALASSSSQVSSLPLREPTATTSSHESSKNSAPAAGAVAASISSELGRAAYMPPESAKVTIAARAHSAPSISSPIVHFYSRGTPLQVLDRENGWVQVADRTSGKSGWVLDQYLIETGGNGTQTVLETSKGLTEPVVTKPMPSARKRVRRPGPQVRNSESVALARLDRRWERRAQRRGGFGLFFFGRFARAE